MDYGRERDEHVPARSFALRNIRTSLLRPGKLMAELHKLICVGYSTYCSGDRRLSCTVVL